jgi:two-component system OmpR family response regulator
MPDRHHVVVVEDEPSVSAMLQEALEHEGGHRVTCVRSEHAARGALELDPPEVMLVDAVLPNGSGLDLARDVIDHCAIVILMTGYPDVMGDLEHAGCPFLHKPFRVGELLSTIVTIAIDLPSHRELLRRSLARIEGRHAPAG